MVVPSLGQWLRRFLSTGEKAKGGRGDSVNKMDQTRRGRDLYRKGLLRLLKLHVKIAVKEV